MFRKSLCVATLGILAMLVSPSVSDAAHGGGGRGGWGGGGRGGYGWGGRGYGGYGYGRGGWGGWGWDGGGLYLGLGYGGYGWPGYYDYGYGYSPYYYSQPYYSSYYTTPYSYSQPYYSSTYYTEPNSYSSTTPMYSTEMGSEEQEEPMLATNAATIEVRCPANAQLWFEGAKTTQTGVERDFISPPLEPNRLYTYTIRAHWRTRDGKEMDETRREQVQAGKVTMVDFFAPNRSAVNTSTSTRGADQIAVPPPRNDTDIGTPVKTGPDGKPLPPKSGADTGTPASVPPKQ